MLNCVLGCLVHFCSLKNAVGSPSCQTVRPTHKSQAHTKGNNCKSSVYNVKILKSCIILNLKLPYIYFMGGNKTNKHTKPNLQALNLEVIFTQALQQGRDRLQLWVLVKRQRIFLNAWSIFSGQVMAIEEHQRISISILQRKIDYLKH